MKRNASNNGISAPLTLAHGRGGKVRATAAERSQPLPGDTLIAAPLATLTHAITINRPARDVWPWLAQMGAGSRAGWYSYDVVDNGRRHSAEDIIPGLQQLTPGMIFPALPGVTDCFTLLEFERERHLILGWQSNDRLVMTWAFVLRESPDGSCRLLVRAREGAGYHFHSLPRWFTARAGAAAHFIMQRQQLRGIKRRAESMPRHAVPTEHAALEVNGHVSKGFEAVREAFAANFARRGELGAACCAFYRDEKVVDLWGGIRNQQSGEPWQHDTMVIVYSATKGLAAMTLALAHSRGWLDYEERVCTYWPEFAQQGKQRITVRQLLAHQAGLYVLDDPVTRALVADLDRLAMVLARQKPAWEPGTRQAYHGITLGFYESELLRRIDPAHRSLGQFFQDEIATPLGLDVYIRLPEGIPTSRLATMARPAWGDMLRGFPLRLALDTFNPRSKITRALRGSELPHEETCVYARNLEVPSGGGVGTARAIARAYSAFASGGRELGLRTETLDLLAAPAVPAAHGFYDECLKSDDVQFSLGFAKPSSALPFGSPSSFGSPGAGGAFGFADPSAGIGYAYVMNRMGTQLSGDPRDVALRDALYSAIAATSHPPGRVA